MDETKWITCPKCGEKTRVKIKQTTIMKDFLLYCHHCKIEFTVNVENYILEVLENDKRSQGQTKQDRKKTSIKKLTI